MSHTATYSLHDNKLRLYPDYCLPKEEYDLLKSAGYKQEYVYNQELARPFADGQPILVGHHSEKRARKLAEKIENLAPVLGTLLKKFCPSLKAVISLMRWK